MLTAKLLRKALQYDQDTGVFLWKAPRPKIQVGTIAGGFSRQGYARIRIDGVSYLAHRLAWLYVHGRWPKHEIDHINRIKSDNRIINLRQGTRSQNRGNILLQANNRTGVRGVIKAKKFSGYIAQLGKGKARYLGCFRTLEAAKSAYEAAAKKHFGEFLC